MKARPVLIAFLALFLLLTVLKPAHAVSISITSFPSTITDQPFTIEASISGATTATNYLRIDLYRDGTSNYFGETFNGSDWYSGSTFSLYLPISVKTGIIWNGSVMGSVGSPTSGEFDGNGSYKMRLRRYTSGGTSNATEANNSAVNVSITMPTDTPTPTPTPETPTDTPTPTPKNNPTNTPTPKKTPTPTPKKTPTPTPSKTSTASGKTGPTKNATQASVLGENTKDAGNVSDIPNPKEDNSIKNSVLSLTSENLVPKITIILGGIFLILCAIFVAYPIIKEKLDEKRNLQN